MFDDTLCRAILPEESRRSLVAHTGAAGEVIGRVTLQREEVSHLLRTLHLELLADLLHPDYIITATVLVRLVYEYVRFDQLPVVLILSHHVSLHSR